MKAAIILSGIGAAFSALVPVAPSSEHSAGDKSLTVRFRGINVPHSRSTWTRDTDKVASHSLMLQKTRHAGLRTWQRHPRNELGDGWDLSADFNLTNSTTSNMTFLYNTNYVIPISIGKQEFKIAVDTGSSDTWVVHSDFTCIDPAYGAVEARYRASISHRPLG